MKFIRALLFLPILVLALPAFVIIGVVVMMMDTKIGTLRSLLAREQRRHGTFEGFAIFMTSTFVPLYRHNVTSFVMAGAAFLVVTVGLRGLGAVPAEMVYASLAIEFTMLIMWAVTVYYTPEEEGGAPGHERSTPQKHAEEAAAMVEALNDLSAHIAILENRLRITETRFDQLKSIESSFHSLATRLDVATGEEFARKFTKDFEKFASLDSSLRGLTERLDVLVSDQLNVRVKREFEKLIVELTKRSTDGQSEG